MLITETVEIEVGNKLKYYEGLGYTVPKEKGSQNRMRIKIGAKIKIKTIDLSNGSGTLVEVKCDCEDCKSPILKPMRWVEYLKHVHIDGKYYCQQCAMKLYARKNSLNTKFLRGESFGYWIIKNLALKQAINIISRWDDAKNGCDIREVSYGSVGMNKKGYWFKCSKGIHESELKSVSYFTNKFKKFGCLTGLDCKACNTFAQWGIDNLGDDFLNKYWNYEKNINIDPWNIPKQWNKKVWIICQEKKHHESYDVFCSKFVIGDRCPYCSGRRVHILDSLGTLYPQVLDIWSNKNIKTPYEYMPHSMQMVYWKCLDDKHEDYPRIIDSSNNCDFRCPDCVGERQESFLQEKVRLYLESLGYLILHEYNCNIIPNNPKYNGNRGQMPFDNEIVDLKLIVEVNGSQHYRISRWHKLQSKKHNTTPEYELHMQKVRDRYKKYIAYLNGYKYIAISYKTDNKKEEYKTLINNKIKEIFNKKI